MNSLRHQLRPTKSRPDGLASLVVIGLSMVCLLGLFSTAAWHAGSPLIGLLSGIANRLI